MEGKINGLISKLKLAANVPEAHALGLAVFVS